MKKYIDVTGENTKANALKIEVYYSLGGMNLFTYKQEKRGYYLSVCPVEQEVIGSVTLESYTAFTGAKVLVKEVKRKSQKAENEALIIAANMENDLINYVCRKNGLTITQNYNTEG